jgi:hypothetical protein
MEAPGGPVRAEVLLRRRDPESKERVVRFLREQGVEVTTVGAASISIRCDPGLFGKLFGPPAKPSSGPAVPQEAGVQARPAAGGPAPVPEAIAELVEGVYPQQPAQLF